MSEPSEQEQIVSQDPLNYAPRWLREKPEPRMPVAEPRAEREAKPETAARTCLPERTRSTVNLRTRFMNCCGVRLTRK